MKNKVLFFITKVAAVLMFLSALSMDSEKVLIPIVLFVLSAGWLYLFMMVNQEKLEEMGIM